MVNKQQNDTSYLSHKKDPDFQTTFCLESFKRRIAKLDRQILKESMPFGIESLDLALAGGLALGRVHMLCGIMRENAAVTGFVSCILVRLLKHLSAGGKAAGPIVWCPASGHDGLYGHGLAALGLNPAQLLVVDTPNPTSRLAALDDIVRTDGLTAVIAEYGDVQKSPDYWMRLIRRLQLSAEASHTTVFLLGAPLSASGCETVWHVAPARLAYHASTMTAVRLQQSWHPVWKLTLQRARGGYSFYSHIEWSVLSEQFMELVVSTHTDTSEKSLSDRASHHVLAAPQPFF